MNWEGIVGHEQPLTMLERALRRGRVSHAYAFLGRPQVGKATVARRFMQALFCDDRSAAWPCLGCRACRRIERGSHPDVHWIEPEGETIGIEQVRTLQEALFLKPFEAAMTAAVVDGADRMTTAAQNSLLKVLEEPPGRAVIILIAANPAALVPTIWSRCQVLHFQPLPHARAAAALESRGVDPARARLLAALMEGRLGAALSALDKDVVAQRDRVAAWVDALADPQTGLRAALQIAEFLEGERETVEEWLRLFLYWLRDLLLVQEGVEQALANQDAEGRLRERAATFSVRALADAMGAVDDARRRLQANANFRLTLDLMLAKVQRSLAS